MSVHQICVFKDGNSVIGGLNFLLCFSDDA
jgi:hypothetical protein